MKQLVQLPPFQNVPATLTAGTAIIPNIPQGRTYDGIIIKFGANMVAADITELRLKAGSKVIWALAGAALNAINQWQGLVNSASYLPLWFIDRTAMTFAGQRLGALSTIDNPFSSLSLEMDLDGTQSGVTVSAIGVVGAAVKPLLPNNASSQNMFRGILKSTNSITGAGDFDLTLGLGTSGANLIRAIHFKHSNMTHLEMQKDGERLIEKWAIADFDFLQDEVLRNNQSGYFTADMIPDGSQYEVLSTLRGNRLPASMRFVGTFSGSDTLISYQDLLIQNIAAL